MADLRVDYELLDSTERTLTSLTSEFQNIKAQEGSYDGAMGSGDIAGAMDSFAGNWDYHRKKLVGSMQALGQMVSQTKQAFQKTDTGLAHDLTKKSK
ncbi:MAG TPA: hypothetical protein VKV33_10780 [Streptosporangiaceae bacterium]|jgi:uncharacterized protein YukE|nr:hypothetical protein [Streptosporangiaceae bacterium]